MELISDWPSKAKCRDGDPDAMFVKPDAQQKVAARTCNGCPVRYECLADALDNRVEFGVWGGMTERERRALLRRHPQVVSWRRAFEAARPPEAARMRSGLDAARVAMKETIQPPHIPQQQTGS